MGNKILEEAKAQSSKRYKKNKKKEQVNKHKNKKILLIFLFLLIKSLENPLIKLAQNLKKNEKQVKPYFFP